MSDDLTIDDADFVIRRIPFGHTKRLPDGRDVPNSDRFRDSDDGSGMSADLLSLLEAEGISVAELQRRYPGFRFWKIKVADLRALNQEIHRQPVEGNPAHVEIFDRNGERRRPTRKKIAKLGEWLDE